jgi:large subunit ribosomal protein L9
MKVVLLKDIKGLGRAHTVLEVKDGYAINMLIPQKKAVEATASAVKNAELKQKSQKDKEVVQHELIASTLASLAEGRVVISKKVNEKGHLYDGVDAKDIAEAAKLPVEAISLEKPIKELGDFAVPVYFGKDFGSITVSVVAQ